jgi:cephalosporin-C deacetylase
MQRDLSLDQLRNYRSALKVPADFGIFWELTLGAARQHELAPEYVEVDLGLPHVRVLDVTFAGWNGDRIAAWLYLPRLSDGPLPAVVQYIGYGAGRGLAHEHLLWSAAGYAHLVVDTRGQGTSTHHIGATPDDPGPTGPHAPGFMTMGIESPERYYYRRVFSDAVRAVDLVCSRGDVDINRVFVMGMSQGGGIALAVAGLVPGLAGVLPDVPFLCDFPRAVTTTDERPYVEIVHYCRAHRDNVEEVFATLGYFDGVAFAARASAPTLFSVALMDETCPPSTVFAAFNAYADPRKEIRVYPFNGHEGGGAFQSRAQLTFVRSIAPLGAIK